MIPWLQFMIKELKRLPDEPMPFYKEDIEMLERILHFIERHG